MKTLPKIIFVCATLVVTQTLSAMKTDGATLESLTVPSENSNKIIQSRPNPLTGKRTIITYQEVHAFLIALNILDATNKPALISFALACKDSDEQVEPEFVQLLKDTGFLIDDEGFVIDPKIRLIVSFGVFFAPTLDSARILTENEIYSTFAMLSMLTIEG